MMTGASAFSVYEANVGCHGVTKDLAQEALSRPDVKLSCIQFVSNSLCPKLVTPFGTAIILQF
jgi:hypothetical protein